MAVPVLKMYYQRTKSSWLPEPAVPVLKLYYQRLHACSEATGGWLWFGVLRWPEGTRGNKNDKKIIPKR